MRTGKNKSLTPKQKQENLWDQQFEKRGPAHLFLLRVLSTGYARTGPEDPDVKDYKEFSLKASRLDAQATSAALLKARAQFNKALSDFESTSEWRDRYLAYYKKVLALSSAERDESEANRAKDLAKSFRVKVKDQMARLNVAKSLLEAAVEKLPPLEQPEVDQVDATDNVDEVNMTDSTADSVYEDASQGPSPLLISSDASTTADGGQQDSLVPTILNQRPNANQSIIVFRQSSSDSYDLVDSDDDMPSLKPQRPTDVNNSDDSDDDDDDDRAEYPGATAHHSFFENNNTMAGRGLRLPSAPNLSDLEVERCLGGGGFYSPDHTFEDDFYDTITEQAAITLAAPEGDGTTAPMVLHTSCAPDTNPAEADDPDTSDVPMEDRVVTVDQDVFECPSVPNVDRFRYSAVPSLDESLLAMSSYSGESAPLDDVCSSWASHVTGNFAFPSPKHSRRLTGLSFGQHTRPAPDHIRSELIESVIQFSYYRLLVNLAVGGTYFNFGESPKYGGDIDLPPVSVEFSSNDEDDTIAVDEEAKAKAAAAELLEMLEGEKSSGNGASKKKKVGGKKKKGKGSSASSATATATATATAAAAAAKHDDYDDKTADVSDDDAEGAAVAKGTTVETAAATVTPVAKEEEEAKDATNKKKKGGETEEKESTEAKMVVSVVVVGAQEARQQRTCLYDPDRALALQLNLEENQRVAAEEAMKESEWIGATSKKKGKKESGRGSGGAGAGGGGGGRSNREAAVSRETPKIVQPRKAAEVAARLEEENRQRQLHERQQREQQELERQERERHQRLEQQHQQHLQQQQQQHQQSASQRPQPLLPASTQQQPVSLQHFAPASSQRCAEREPLLASTARRAAGRGPTDVPAWRGLINLGNTCYLNVVVQCLSIAPTFAEWFLQENYIDDINTVSRMGSNGALARVFANLLIELRQGSCSSSGGGGGGGGGLVAVRPLEFRKAVGDLRAEFASSSQQDCQEFLALLLDGLHEDLNRVNVRPYIERTDSNGRADAEVAREHWEQHVARDNSIVVDTLQGLYRSALTCPCDFSSVAFDPFMYLTLQIPDSNYRTQYVTFIQPTGRTQRLGHRINRNNRGIKLRKFVASCCPTMPPRSTILLLLVVQGGVKHVLTDDDCLFELDKLAGDTHYDLVAYVVDRTLCHLPVIHRYAPIGFECSLCRRQRSDTVRTSSCAGCYQACYCSRDCQREHWAEHKALCRPRIITTTLPSVISYDPSRADTYTVSELHALANETAGVSLLSDFYENLDAVVVAKVRPCRLDGGKLSTTPALRAWEDDEAVVDVSSVEALAIDWSLEPEKFFQLEQMIIKQRESIRDHSSIKTTVHCEAKHSTSLVKCLEHFQKPDLLCDKDAWNCPGCKSPQPATKTMSVWRFPPVLIIHLKRFVFTGERRIKVDTPVSFPLNNLDLNRFEHGLDDGAGPAVYDCFGVCNHHERFSMLHDRLTGHYTAFMRPGMSSEWLSFDDTKVSVMQPHEVQSAAAYVLFYSRRTVKT